MTNRSYSLTTGTIFLAIAIVHGLRLIFGWDASLEGHHAPMWASGVALIITGYLSYAGFRLGRRSSYQG